MLLIMLSAINIAMAQDSAKIINITDNRNLGLYKWEGCDAPTTGFKDGDVSVDRILDLDTRDVNRKNDTISGYMIHFYKIFGENLRNYRMSVMHKDDYDKVSYFWRNNTEVSITLFNSATKKKYNMILSQSGSTVGWIHLDE